MVDVRAADPSDVPALAEMLARAFAHDPVSSSLLPDEMKRPARLRGFFSFVLRHHYLTRGEVQIAAGGQAAALWMPPWPRSPNARERLAHLQLGWQFGRNYLLAQRLGAVLAQRHPRVPHYYLGVLGTDPAHQGEGLASSLLAPMFERCDREGVLAYLESSREANVAFYARFGFTVREEVLFGRGVPRIWLMERRAC